MKWIKDFKVVSMATKKTKKQSFMEAAHLLDWGKLGNKVSIDRKKWLAAIENQNRSTAILQPIGFDILLGFIIERAFPQRRKDVRNLMNGINLIQKARLAYILGLINKTVLKDLEQIHEIRNKFGHSFEASFAYTKVLKFVRKLSTANGHEVTEKNSYEFYSIALVNCFKHLVAVLQKQISRDKTGTAL